MRITCTSYIVTDPKTIFSDLIYRVRLRESLIVPEFLTYQLLSRVGRCQIERDARGSSGTMPKISHSHIKAWRILLPSLEEQERIVGLINTNCSPIDSAISRLTHEIHLLLEYRTRLVSDVVTGKLDVREAAAKLPDETVPGDAVEDIDEIAEDGVASDEEIAV
jgi:type I restriction enzyme S subunit